ncbi:IclR family transcriptional regulator [Amycolatopsis endophytica]|uniref:DNA-binding IclR family transcriptional regulator n=1 Tax=Amycolatopsis endophytica TaxID=860233 RepID=A0A853B8V7_9PSEU|nr:IclR family transcriptional regulator [Amycolatopsis endophytica]NYI91559.1 DNA-binding IclR family transcriptional regulator [Amycolatopsis endophytica]
MSSDAQRTDGGARNQGHGLRRDVDLLEALASEEAQHAGGLGVVRLAHLVGREKSQVSRALKALAEVGIVERDPDTLEYRLGWRLFSLVARTVEDRLLRAAEPVMHTLSGELEETVHLCVLRENQVLTLLSVSGHSFRVHGWEGRGVPAPCTSAGRVLLSDATPDELYVRFGLQADLGAGCPRSPVRTLPDLWSAIQRSRRDGYAAVREEFEEDLVGVSAPVRDFRGRVVAALNVSAPKDRLAARLADAGRVTARAAGVVSEQLGWRMRPVPPSSRRFT